VPFEKLFSVLKKEQQLFTHARELLLAADPYIVLGKQETIWLHTELLLSIKVPDEHISQIVSAAKKRYQDFRFATDVYISLVQWGIEEQTAVTITVKALDSSLSGNDFAGILNIFIKGRTQYLSPDKIGTRIIHELPSSATIQILEDRVLY